MPQDARDLLAFFAATLGLVVTAVPKDEPGSLRETPPAPPKPKLPAGWAIPGAAKKAHYFPADDARSLCGKWAYWVANAREDTSDNHPENCADCKRRVAAHRAKEGAK